MNVNILVAGANGQVGQELQYLARFFNNFQFTFTDATKLDITDHAAVHEFFEQHDFHYCLNCAAYTAVDKAETDEALAIKVNVDGPRNLASCCLGHKISLIHLSTDYVYHNDLNRPLREDDPTHPQSVYARTKLDGDLVALETNSSTTIIRTSWVYSSFGHNFVKTMLRLGKERDELRVVFDQIGTPTYARDLARVLLNIIEKVESNVVSRSALSGIFHYSNEGVTSWYDFAKAIFDIENIKCTVKPIETIDYPTPAQRPPFSVLNKAKIKSHFGLTIPHWRDSLRECLKELKN